MRGDTLKISVMAPPERGKANQAVCALVAARLGLSRSEVTVISGGTARDKTLQLEGVTRGQALALLERWAGGDW